MIIKKIFIYILSFFQVIFIFESKKNRKTLYYKNYDLKKYSSIKSIKIKKLVDSLKKEKKIERFKSKKFLMVLFYKKNVVCTGWMFKGLKWHITEVNKVINIKDKILLYDFFTLPKFRNKGYYSKLLNLIKNDKTKKSFLIYCLKTNNKSRQGILNSKFTLINEIKK
jgi:hypothetical protein